MRKEGNCLSSGTGLTRQTGLASASPGSISCLARLPGSTDSYINCNNNIFRSTSHISYPFVHCEKKHLTKEYYGIIENNILQNITLKCIKLRRSLGPTACKQTLGLRVEIPYVFNVRFFFARTRNPPHCHNHSFTPLLGYVQCNNPNADKRIA